MKPNEEQSQSIQVLRGIAICAVILIHTNAGGLAGVLIRPHVNFCVGLFNFSVWLSDSIIILGLETILREEDL